MSSIFLSTLKSGLASGDFIKLKNSYKLSPNFKKKLVKQSDDANKPKKDTKPKK
jgi:hypothetical protein